MVAWRWWWGNSTYYARIGRLPNTQNDAADISATLRRLGFEVTTELDADRVEMTDALRTFTRRSARRDVSLVFYAGHGIEMDGVNYLVPVDARLERDVDVRFETVTLDDLLVSTVGASLRLVILDACRNNPLARSMQRTAARGYRGQVVSPRGGPGAHVGTGATRSSSVNRETDVDCVRLRRNPLTGFGQRLRASPTEVVIADRSRRPGTWWRRRVASDCGNAA